ncbi:UDP-N-acetylenolpyruvoylglucosamine reductase [Bacteroidia bacterium]|nr:UDP-N-acetylenolpyruvoylglucosamine reductase [Bacteroidia bacterium]
MNYPLHNTFGFDVRCSHFYEVASEQSLLQLIDKKLFTKSPFFVLGGGSNVLFLDDFEGIVIHPTMQGIEVVQTSDEQVLVQVGAGVVWDDFVDYCVQHQYYGVENLSLIYGNVGAAPVQNIGAYGVEAQQVIHSVGYIDIASGATHVIDNARCDFAYRNSIFKQSLKNKIVITSVTFALRKTPQWNIRYGEMQQAIEQLGEVNLHNLRQAIINIRRRKLPDPLVCGNAGSFFKNPVVSKDCAQGLLSLYPSMPVYDSGDDAKLSAAWLIEQCGWKGRRQGNVGVHSQQALVLVNYGNGTGKEVLHLSQNIAHDVLQRFGVGLDTEVCVISSHTSTPPAQ